MNWNMAKNWLIVAFLVLDAILGWQLYQNRQMMTGYVENESDLLANTRTILSEHGFSLEAKIPTKTVSLMPLLHSDTPSIGLHELVDVAFPQQRILKLNPVTGESVTANGIVQVYDLGRLQVSYHNGLAIGPDMTQAPTVVWHAGDYVRDEAMDSQNLIAYDQHYLSYPIFDSYVYLQTTHRTLKGYSQAFSADIYPVGSSKPIVSAMDALGILANSVDKLTNRKDNRILSIALGYAHKATNSDDADTNTTNYLFPVWRIVTNHGNYFVNAYTGELASVSI